MRRKLYAVIVVTMIVEVPVLVLSKKIKYNEDGIEIK